MKPGLLWSFVDRRLRRRLPEQRAEPILVDLFEDYLPRRRTARVRAGFWLLSEARSLEVAYRAERRVQTTGQRAPLTEFLWREMRLGWRSLARTPVVTSAIALTLAIGIGANAAIFAIVNGVLLRPLPYPDEDRVVSITHRSPSSSTDIPSAPYLYFTYRDTARTFERLGLWSSGLSTVTELDRPEQVRAIYVTHEILPLLGAAPFIGTTFSQIDDEPGRPLTTVLTWGYWQRRFGGDPAVIGRQFTIDGMRTSVIGVLPKTFRFLDQPVDLIYPWQLDQGAVTLGRYTFQSLGRMRPGVSIEEATADLTAAVPVAINRFPPPPGFTRERFLRSPMTVRLTPVRDVVIGDIGRTLWVLMGALGLVLVIACANVAHLLLVRADGRRRNFAVQAALGASRARLAAGQLIEGIIFGVMGGIGGLGVAYAALQGLLLVGPANLPRAADVTLDPLVLAFTLALSLASGVGLGVLPVLRIARRNLAPSLIDGGRASTESPEQRRTRGGLVIVQVALAIVLLVCSGLMIRTFQSLAAVEPGFSRPEEVQLVYIAGSQQDPAQTLEMQRRLVSALASIPGVLSAGFGDRAPLEITNRRADTVLTVEAPAKPRVEGEPRPLRRFEFISPGFFQSLGTPILAGRDFGWTDLDKARQVTIVSAELARQEWGSSAAALGKRVRITPADPWRDVVGVAGDLRDNGMQEAPPAIVYFPARVQNFWGAAGMAFGNGTFLIRTSRAGTDSLIREIERVVAGVDKNLPVSQVRRLSDVYRASLARTSFTLKLLLLAGSLGLLLGVIGIYGVVAYSVSQRTREVGIRLALGAQRGEVTRMFLRRGIALASIGLVSGVLIAMLVTRLMSSLLFGVSPVDPLTYVVVASIVLAVVTCAAYIPARRSTRDGCVEALRAD